MAHAGSDLVFLDTHILIWLAGGHVSRLSKAARQILKRKQPAASPFGLLELQLLREVGRVTAAPEAIAATLQRDIGLILVETSLMRIAQAACTFSWTRDPFDRLIAAAAQVENALLITADTIILKHYPPAVW